VSDGPAGRSDTGVKIISDTGSEAFQWHRRNGKMRVYDIRHSVRLWQPERDCSDSVCYLFTMWNWPSQLSVASW